MPFENIAGNLQAKMLLEGFLRQGELNRGFIFAGPRGIGKEPFAMEFAKAILCEKEGAFGCGSCRSCLLCLRSIHPYLKILSRQDHEKNLPIERVRTFEKEVRLRPYHPPAMVGVVKEAERLSIEAANCMLKILEEPPSYLTIILLTEAPSMLPPTLLSRCVIIRFFPIPEEMIIKELQERSGFDRFLSELCGKLSGGSIGNALKLAEVDLAGLLEKLQEVIIEKDFGRFINWTKSQKNFTREDAKLVIEIILLILREIIRASSLRDYRSGLLKERLWQKYKRYPLEELIRMMEKCMDLKHFIDLNVNINIAMEEALLQFA
jgi:DNA polymerase-3 subunit delta'